MELKYRRVWLKGLVIDCPFNKALNTCPAKDIRKLPLAKRMAYVDNLTMDQVDEALYLHQKCLAQRELA